MTPDGALKLAEEAGLDLVEISPNAKPPVCKIMDYGKFKYEKQKKEQENKKRQVKISIKEIKLRPNTDAHDIGFKVNHIRRFIEDKDKAKITVQFRGREMAHMERAKGNLNKIIESLADIAEPEAPPKVEGRTLSVIIAPLKSKSGAAKKAAKAKSEPKVEVKTEASEVQKAAAEAPAAESSKTA